VDLLHILHALVDAVLEGTMVDILVLEDRPFLDDEVEPVAGPRLEGSCCHSSEGSRLQPVLGSHLENYQ